jgi:cytochrome o ubiquinol oxidase subunit II
MKKIKLAILIALLMPMAYMIPSGKIVVLEPKGIIALKERSLIYTATALMLIVVIPVFVLAGYVVWKYRASKKGKYTPDWDYSWQAEAIWWGFPLLIVVALSVVVWKSSHELDPYKPLDMSGEPMTIQVVALQWKWLFLYPEKNIATVNFVKFPVNRAIHFEITSDAPMNSFWIPELGGQIYAMKGMKTKLNLMASEMGSFRGSSANLSGDGFAGMVFAAQAVSEEEFESWAQSAQTAPLALNWEEYDKLAKPSKNNSPVAYQLQENNLFEQVVCGGD